MHEREYALITGASSGIGAALALKLAKEGFNLILLGQNTLKLEKLAFIISQKFELDVLTYKLNLINTNEIDQFVNKLKQINKNITLFVNNAGIGYFGEFAKINIDEDKKIIDINIRATTIFLKNLIPLLSKNAHVLMVASTAAFSPGPYMATYYASKAYILALSLALREELGLQVSVLAPGPTKTKFQERAQMCKNDIVKLFYMHPIKVASKAYDGVIQNKSIIVPGFLNKISVLALILAPYSIKSWLVKCTQKLK
ncbi:hypothetical protein AN641_06210 [Candidatus Epulonipiscioides gigas]|nr:hypothetical protein AN641_06210 [Epulopiscium sp. SCG-C07WGA-EpuloA2]